MNILVFAPHNDDEVLGAGGTIAKYVKNGHNVYICEATSGEMYKTLQEEALVAHSLLGVKDTFFLNLPVTELRNMNVAELNHAIGEVVEKIKPNVAFIPHRGDMHLDHIEVAKAAMVALRPIDNPQLLGIYAYETLSETEWNIPSLDNLFIPSAYNDISNELDIKLKAMGCYESQLKAYPHPRSLETIKALAMVRGSTICAPYAESFMVIRSIL